MKFKVFLLSVVILSGVFTIINFNTYLNVDKKVIKPVALAGSVVTLKADSSAVSMEELLMDAVEEFEDYKGRNAAWVWHTSLYEADNLIEVLKKSKIRAHQLGLLEDAILKNRLTGEEPDWVKKLFISSQPDLVSSRSHIRLLSSENLASLGVMYEAFNDAVSGEVSVSGDKVSSSNMALVNLFEKACSRTFWKPGLSHRDFRNAHGETYIALLYANMGYLQEAKSHLSKSYDYIKKERDRKNIAVFRDDVRGLTVGDLKKSLKSAIKEIEKLESVPEEFKYTSGWWLQLQKKLESLGASDVYIGDMAEKYKVKYGGMALTLLIIFLLSGALYIIIRLDIY